MPTLFRAIRYTNTAVVFLFLIFPNLLLAQEVKKFRVDSYIPQRFEDLQFYFDGNLGITGNNSGLNTSASTNALSQRDESMDEWRFGMTSRLTYLNRTADRFYQLFLDLQGSAFGSNRDMQYEYKDVLGGDGRLIRNEDAVSRNIDLFGLLNGTFQQFVIGDMSLRADLIVRGDYNELSKGADDQSRVETHSFNDTIYQIESTYSRSRHYDSKRYSIDGIVTAGWGRRYEGIYAATALNMIRELRKHNVIEREPTEEQLFEITDLIYRYRQTSSPDRRLLRIESLNGILEYLASEEIIGERLPYHHLLIEDVWDYFPQDPRYFGWQARSGVAYYHDWSMSQSDEWVHSFDRAVRTWEGSVPGGDTLRNDSSANYSYYHNSQDNVNAYMVAEAEWSKPIGLDWQLEIFGDSRYYIYEPQNDIRRTLSDHFALETGANLKWLLDGRTEWSMGGIYKYNSITSTYRVYASYLPFDFDEVTESNAQRFDISSRFSYRISVPTSLIITGNVSRLHSTVSVRWSFGSNDRENDETLYGLNARIRHYLF